MDNDKKPCQSCAQQEQNIAPAFLEQYKLYVQSADNTSGRRVSVNHYQTSLNVGIVALYGITATIRPEPILQTFIAITGVIISIIWLYTINSLSRLNTEKFAIIISMEKNLPRAVYKEEWQRLDLGKGWKYRGASFFEKCIPPVFTTLHLVMLVYSLREWAA